MKDRPLRTTVIGSYPFPGWLEFGMSHAEAFGPSDREEMIEDAVIAALHDQLQAGVDVVTDGEQARIDFNLSFYSFLEGIEQSVEPLRRFGPPAHDQRGKHRVVGTIRAPRGLGTVAEFKRLERLAPKGYRLKASVPDPYTLSGRLLPNSEYQDRFALTEALIPLVQQELEDLVEAGCQEIAVDAPSMSCYAHREDPRRFVAMFNQTVEGVAGRCRLCMHLCFGNYKGRAVGYRSYRPMFPEFLDMKVDEMHVEMASREFSELEVISSIAERMDVAVGIVDVKSYYIETVDDVANRVRECLKHAPAERLHFAPDCGLSQTARWAARKKLENMVQGVLCVRKELGF